MTALSPSQSQSTCHIVIIVTALAKIDDNCLLSSNLDDQGSFFLCCHIYVAKNKMLVLSLYIYIYIPHMTMHDN